MKTTAQKVAIIKTDADKIFHKYDYLTEKDTLLGMLKFVHNKAITLRRTDEEALNKSSNLKTVLDAIIARATKYIREQETEPKFI